MSILCQKISAILWLIMKTLMLILRLIFLLLSLEKVFLEIKWVTLFVTGLTSFICVIIGYDSLLQMWFFVFNWALLYSCYNNEIHNLLYIWHHIFLLNKVLLVTDCFIVICTVCGTTFWRTDLRHGINI